MVLLDFCKPSLFLCGVCHSVLFGSLCLSVESALLPQQAIAGEIPRMYRSAYHLGMGDTGIAFAKGADAVFYNPAGIAASKSLLVEASIISPQVEVARSSENIYRQVASGKDGLEVASSATGKPQYAAIQNYSGVVFQRAAMGLFQRAQLDAFVGSDPKSGLPSAELGASLYVGSHLSYARPLSDSLYLGTNVKVVQKAQSRLKVNALEAQELADKNAESYLKKLVKRGTGVGADVGVLYQTDSATKTTFGAVARDIGLTYHWPAANGTPLPDAEPSVVDVGVVIEPETRKSRSRLALDFRDVFDEQKENVYKRIHLGAELNFQGVLGGTVGLNQGYLAYGGYVSFWLLRVEAGVYSEEFGEYPGNRQSKRAYACIGLGWFE
jgi:hypothetical protein